MAIVYKGLSGYYGMMLYKDTMIPVYSYTTDGQGNITQYDPIDQVNAGVAKINNFSIIINPDAINEEQITKQGELLDIYGEYVKNVSLITNSVNSGYIRTLINMLYAGQGAEAHYLIKKNYNVTTFTELFDYLINELNRIKTEMKNKIDELYYTEKVSTGSFEDTLKYGNAAVRYVPYNKDEEAAPDVINVFGIAIPRTAAYIGGGLLAVIGAFILTRKK